MVCSWIEGRTPLIWVSQFQLPHAVLKAPGVEALLELLGCECALEMYLREHPPVEANFDYAKGHLVQVREDLVKLIRVGCSLISAKCVCWKEA